jgi:hypothetical protein
VVRTAQDALHRPEHARLIVDDENPCRVHAIACW